MKFSYCIYILLMLNVNLFYVTCDCPPGKKTYDPQGRCCVFPFEYGGVSYNSCTTVANGNTPWCSFDAVYSGNWANCANPCQNNPCNNGGTCAETGVNSYSCHCAEGFYGDSCEEVSPCKPGTCKNGGTCTMTDPDSYSCKCTDEFEGDNCEKRIPCPPGKKTYDPQGRCCVFPFEYAGVSYNSCTTVANGNTQWCSFDAVYSGNWANCANPCQNNPCNNGGTCAETGVNSYSCHCAEGFYGDSCEEVSPCKPGTCKNGGTCTMTDPDSYSCKCTDEFEGDNCEKRIPCPPGKKTYDPQGRCCVFPFEYGGVTYNSCTTVANGNKPWCSFDAVYSGKWANCDVDECISTPCKNDATCVNQPQGYSCICNSGYKGEQCEIEIDECASNPCDNGCTCKDEVAQYVCECPAGYEGEDCETKT